ncbi:MAG TPA: pseudouridine synthase, partial [Myxococcaceae bacterium]|nr:pseudouridine synthase [Myxococcaceae bacterium]
MVERLQKYLARAGVASRRHAEELITQGRVSVNNAVVRELGTKVESGRDLVTVDGQLIQPAEDRAYFVLYKPAGVVTTMEDPQGRPSVAQYVRQVGRRVFPVGRLDFDAEGALLFTDDGELANALTHPSYEVRRTYLAKVKGTPSPESLARLREGVRLEDGVAKALEADVFEEAERNTWIRVVVGEGRQHLVKRMCAAIGHPVVRLYRPAHGGMGVEGLEPGALRPLTGEEVERLKAVARGEAPALETLSLPPRRHGRGAPGTTEEDDEVNEDSRLRPSRRGENRSGRTHGGRGARAFGGGGGRERGGRDRSQRRFGGQESGGSRREQASGAGGPRGYDRGGGRARAAEDRAAWRGRRSYGEGSGQER